MPPSLEVSVSTELRIPMLVEQQREPWNAVSFVGHVQSLFLAMLAMWLNMSRNVDCICHVS